MGNITSKGKGVYFFVDPLEESRKRRALSLKAQAKAREKLEKKEIPIPEIFVKEIIPECAQKPEEAPQPTTLTCYEVICGKEHEIWLRLFSLTSLMRVEPTLSMLATDPRLIFHLRGDFGNPRNNGLLSALFATKRASTKIRDGGTQEISFIHIFEPDGQAPDFATVLEELVQRGMLHQSTLHFDSDTTESLRTFALLWARSNFQGIDPIGGDEITKGLEEVEWQIYERITHPRQTAVEWFNRYGEALAMLPSLLRLWQYLN